MLQYVEDHVRWMDAMSQVCAFERCESDQENTWKHWMDVQDEVV